MQIEPAAVTLAKNGLEEPALRALVPNRDVYSAVLLQPDGDICADHEGVRHFDRDTAHLQYRKFLEDAARSKADLVATPEYSMPWKTLVETVEAQLRPTPGAIWVLGCESIQYGELEALRDRIADAATMLFEPLIEERDRFMDPLAYVFMARDTAKSDTERLVILVQFKTCAMGGKEELEVQHLQCGSTVYIFGSLSSVRMVALICSDALSFETSHAKEIYDRTLVLHLQLTPNPRHEQLRRYRDLLLEYAGDETELVCLNWAKNVRVRQKDGTHCWNNIAASAWYLRPDKFDDGDVTLTENHRRGLYYTWFDTLRYHVLFFNFQPASYYLSVTKVAHIGVKSALSNRTGPKLNEVRAWNPGSASWETVAASEDGFNDVAFECGGAAGAIVGLAATNPFLAERILALCAGSIQSGAQWHRPTRLDSCVISQREAIQRMTFCQDPDQDACNFRISRLKRCARLWQLLKDRDLIPPALRDILDGFQFEWALDSPHQNIRSLNGLRATVIYMGEESGDERLESIWRRAAAYLHHSDDDPDASLVARQRLAVWYRDDGGNIVQYKRDHFSKYDDPRTESAIDIVRET